MWHNMIRALVALSLASGTALSAQTTDTTDHATRDSAIQRARKLVEDGKAADGRKLLDSLVKSTPQESASYADALYWRAALAPAAVDAERDYRRLLIEAPLSVRAEDAMLQLAQLEQARGDRRAASDHLQRFLLSYPKNPARPRVALSLVRLLFDQGLVARGCDALRVGRESIPAENAEMRNQLEFYAPKCVSFDVASPGSSADSAVSSSAAAPPDTTRRAPPASASPPVPRPSPVTAPPSTAKSGSAFYSVQVAAYESREPATRMARLLVSRGLEARVDGKARPYRVRVGRYSARSEAVKAAATLKSQGIGGFVTLVR
jgi:cell division septation protein DedD